MLEFGQNDVARASRSFGDQAIDLPRMMAPQQSLRPPQMKWRKEKDYACQSDTKRRVGGPC